MDHLWGWWRMLICTSLLCHCVAFQCCTFFAAFNWLYFFGGLHFISHSPLQSFSPSDLWTFFFFLIPLNCQNVLFWLFPLHCDCGFWLSPFPPYSEALCNATDFSRSKTCIMMCRGQTSRSSRFFSWISASFLNKILVGQALCHSSHWSQTATVSAERSSWIPFFFQLLLCS